MPHDFLEAAPFNLAPADRDWVLSTFGRLTRQEKVAQLFVLISIGNDPAELERLAKLQPAGITRMFMPDVDHELAFIDAVNHLSDVPPLISSDLEGSRMSLPFGTQVLNPLGLAAVDDVTITREVSRIMAEEAVAVGINWTFTPVLDINAAFRSAIVATRGFGADVEMIEKHAMAQMETFQAHGIAATVKHWPGEGYDDRDQHLVTTINPLDMDQWEAEFGRLYRTAIDAGVLSVMSAHIALPSFVRSIHPEAGLEAYRPASINHLLNIDLLRNTLGFNGLIVSDASEMAGLTSWCSAREAKVQLIANGCDIILFSQDPEAEMAAILAAVDSGSISQRRFDEAVMRVLGLKAALGLHTKKQTDFATRKSQLATTGNVALARSATGRAPTLVKDIQNLMPLSVKRHRRILVFSGGIISPLHPQPFEFAVPDLLRDEGFEVTLYTPHVEVSPEAFDLVLYLFGEETLLTRGRIFLDWARLGGNFVGAMQRYWHDIPTAMISFGYPYYLYDAPRVPTYVNAYCTMDDMQCAVVDCLMGRKAWNQNNPVDPFCGLEDAHY
ncbi:MAG: glycoside hydrolase family 3 N-terminal domain-containing protein [Rhizobiaceae bacterium]|nr:glycoside hydrolase family 3 N-terminal domain-containing protein [Rhizobiaceae bacterium]